jgi:hypothetical protein
MAAQRLGQGVRAEGQRGSKARRHIAIVALARKLLVSLWAMLRDGTRWRDPDWKDRCAGGGCAGGGGFSPPEDTGPNVAVSSAVAVAL